MGRTYRYSIIIVLLSLLLIIACAPLNIFGPTNNSRELPTPAAGSDVLTVDQTPTAPVVVLSSSTIIPVVQQVTLTPSSSELYAFIQAPEGPVAMPFILGMPPSPGG